MSTDHPNPRPPGRPIYRLAGMVGEVFDEGAKTIPIGAEAASGQIEAALRLHQPAVRDFSS
jgi:hypothetical protein